MTSTKPKDPPRACDDAPGTDTDDVYLPVCCGEFGVRQAARFRGLWETTWSQDRRQHDKKAKSVTPSSPEALTRTPKKVSPGK